MAVGAVAFGALAIGALAIDDLVVHRLTLPDRDGSEWTTGA